MARAFYDLSIIHASKVMVMHGAFYGKGLLWLEHHTCKQGFPQCHGSKVLMPFGILQWYIGATTWSSSTNALLPANVQEAELVAGKYSAKSRQDTRQPRKVGVSMNTQISAAKGAVNGLSKTAMSPLLRYPFGKLCSGTSVHLYLQARQTPSQCFWQEKQAQPKQALAQRP